MTKNIQELTERYLSGKAGLTDKLQLLGLLKDSPEAAAAFRKKYESFCSSFPGQSDSALDLVRQRASRRRMRILVVTTAIAASVLLVLLFGIGNAREPQSTLASALAALHCPDDRTVLALSPDQLIFSDAEEVHIRYEGDSIRMDGQCRPLDDKNAVHCLSVPYGHRAELLLPDGSSVRLNAHSQMAYPAHFGSTRSVYMEGDAFLDVAKDAASPFRVNTPQLSLKVLGTRFFVYAGPDAPDEVVLVDGSVCVSAGEDAEAVTLTPRQRCSVDESGRMAVTDVDDMEERLALIDGRFRADNHSLGSLFSYMERYYGVPVVCDAASSDLTVSGILVMKPSLDEMLAELSAFLPIECRRENGGWTVSQAVAATSRPAAGR